MVDKLTLVIHLATVVHHASLAVMVSTTSLIVHLVGCGKPLRLIHGVRLIHALAIVVAQVEALHVHTNHAGIEVASGRVVRHAVVGRGSTKLLLRLLPLSSLV